MRVERMGMWLRKCVSVCGGGEGGGGKFFSVESAWGWRVGVLLLLCARAWVWVSVRQNSQHVLFFSFSIKITQTTR